MTEQELVLRAKNGDMSAFGELISQNERKIFALTYRMVGTREDGEDLAQEAFLNAWKGLKNFQGDSSFSTWVYRLATNVCLDHIRKQKRRQEVTNTAPLEYEDGEALSLPDRTHDPQHRLEKKELQASVQQGLEQLSLDHRQILTMREFSGMSYDQIAAALDLDSGTVKSRIARARNSLRKILEKSFHEGTF